MEPHGRIPVPRDDIREAAQEQHEYLNHALLIELWPHLHLDVRIIAAWENTFDSLHGKTNGGASTPHPRTRRNSIPAAQECTPPASLCRGFRHTRATIGDVGKPRAIRQNPLVGACPGVVAWVDEFVPTDHVVGQSGGTLDPPARRLTGSSHVRVYEVSEWAGVGRSGPECRWWRGRRAHPAASRAQLHMEGCGGEWFGVPVPRFFLCVGALHPIRRQCTSSVRVHRHVTGAPPHIGCSAPVLVATVGVAGVFWA